jgi:type II secretory pathway pseudopilin PulG
MKLSSLQRAHSRRTGACAFTLSEMLIAMAVFTMVIGAMLGVQIFGMRIYTLAATKLSATASCRKALNQIRDQIREAKLVDVGNCPSGPASFTNLGLSATQVGNAVKLYAASDTNSGYTIFYLDYTGGTNYLIQYTVTVSNNISGGVTNNYTNIYSTVLAGFITNRDIFAAQDYQGNILTNEDQLDNELQSIPNRLVIFVKLQFSQWEYPIAKVGANSNAWNSYDYYQLRTKVTRRAWN